MPAVNSSTSTQHDDLVVRCSECGEPISIGTSGDLQVLSDPSDFLRRHQACLKRGEQDRRAER